MNDDYHLLTEMQEHGVIVVKEKINHTHIVPLITEVNRIKNQVVDSIAKMARPLKTYSDIAERQLGRLDFRCGFNAKIFQEVAEPIIKLIRELSPNIDFRYYWGAIPSQAGAGPTDMHRDVYPILNNCTGMNLCDFDVQLPPYYFTVLIPLVPITKENGPTVFIKGSHRETMTEESTQTIYSPLLNPGDIVIFDGRTMHKGQANASQQERMIAYITFIAKWYYDQTFVLNDYLLPHIK